MDRTSAQSGLSLSPPPPAEMEAAASSSGSQEPTPPPTPKFSEVFGRPVSMQDVEDLPVHMSHSEVAAIAGMNIDERAIQIGSEPLYPLSRTSSSSSLASNGSSASSTSSLASSEDLEAEESEVPAGKQLLGLPERTHYIWPESLTHLLANLIMNRLSEDEKLAIPAKELELFCEQAMGDMNYLIELSEKILTNLKLLNLPETAAKAIRNKLEQAREPYQFLKQDIDSCLEQFKKGQYKEVRRFTQAVSLDKPGGRSHLVTVTTDYVDKLIYAWTYALRYQEEWRKAMPAPSEIIEGATLPDMGAPDPKKESAKMLAAQLVKDTETMISLWNELEARVGPAKKRTLSYKTVETRATPSSPVKQLPALVPAPYGDRPHNASFTTEHYQLPVVFDFGKSVDIQNPEIFSRWVMSDKKEYETRKEETFESMEEAEKALEDAENEDRNNPERFGISRQQEGGIETCYAAVTTRPGQYFKYQPVAKHALQELVEVGKTNTRKVNDQATMLARDNFENDRFNKQQRGDWRNLRKELFEKSCGLWSLRIPSLQETVDACCDKQHRREVKKLRKKKGLGKYGKDLMKQFQRGFARVRQSLHSPRITPSTTPDRSCTASPVAQRRVLHTQSDPDFTTAMTMPTRPKSLTSLSHTDLMARLQAEEQKQIAREQPKKADKPPPPAIVIEPGEPGGELELPAMLYPGLGINIGALSTISSDRGSSPSEEGLTPRDHSDSSPGSTSPDELTTLTLTDVETSITDSVTTPMVEAIEDPFSQASSLPSQDKAEEEL